MHPTCLPVPRPPARRSLLLAAVAAAAAGWPRGTWAQALPQRNLLIELRQVEDERAADSGVAPVTRGSVTIGSDGRVRGYAEGQVGSRTRDLATTRVQQVLVLNGGRAGVRLAETVPLEFYQVALTPQGVEVLPSAVWSEAGGGFTVSPRWPGGGAPVVVEFAADHSDGARREERLGTVQARLEEWVTVARSVESGQRRSTGALSSRDAAIERQQVLQIRVSVP